MNETIEIDKEEYLKETVTQNISMPRYMRKEITRLAEERTTPVSRWIREAIQEKIEKEKNNG